MTTLGDYMTNEDIEEMVGQADKNGDGRIDYEGIPVNLFRSPPLVTSSIEHPVTQSLFLCTKSSHAATLKSSVTMSTYFNRLFPLHFFTRCKRVFSFNIEKLRSGIAILNCVFICKTTYLQMNTHNFIPKLLILIC